MANDFPLFIRAEYRKDGQAEADTLRRRVQAALVLAAPEAPGEMVA